MSAPPRPRAQETSRELAEARGADFGAHPFLATVEAQQQEVLENQGQNPTDPTGLDQAWHRCRQLESEAETAYQERLARWRANEAPRRQAERAYQRAQQRRAAELGGNDRVPVAACLDWTRPARLGIEGWWTR